LVSTFILGGLRYSSAQIENLYLDLNMTLEDSTTYQLILNKGITQGRAQGRVEEARRMVLRLAVKRFGPTPSNAEAAILAISDHDRLERMVDRVHDAAGWDDLLATS
jgi:predicted transposase YdaD